MMTAATAETIKPLINGLIGSSLSSLALTKKVPKIEVQMAPERARSGKTTPLSPKSDPPKIMAATMVSAYDSNTSAAIPAQSPTLSPTLSAIVAGFRGSSSGIPASILPTKSAPTSAALVKIPPPTRMKSARSAAPNPYPTKTSVAFLATTAAP